MSRNLPNPAHRRGWAVFWVSLCGAFLLSISPVHGTEPASRGVDLLSVKAPDLWSQLLRMGASLAAVLGLMTLAVYVLRKFGGRRFGMAGGGRVIRVVANQYLGGKSQVSVIEVDGERLLLGVSPERINLLCRLDPSRTSSDFSKELSNLREREHPQRSGK